MKIAFGIIACNGDDCLEERIQQVIVTAEGAILGCGH
jgi:hypothetical protein